MREDVLALLLQVPFGPMERSMPRLCGKSPRNRQNSRQRPRRESKPAMKVFCRPLPDFHAQDLRPQELNMSRSPAELLTRKNPPRVSCPPRGSAAPFSSRRRKRATAPRRNAAKGKRARSWVGTWRLDCRHRTRGVAPGSQRPMREIPSMFPEPVGWDALPVRHGPRPREPALSVARNLSAMRGVVTLQTLTRSALPRGWLIAA